MNFRSTFTALALSAIAASVASAQQGDKKAPTAPVQQAGVTVAKADSGAKTSKKKGGKKKKAAAKKDSTKAEAKKSS